MPFPEPTGQWVDLESLTTPTKGGPKSTVCWETAAQEMVVCYVWAAAWRKGTGSRRSSPSQCWQNEILPLKIVGHWGSVCLCVYACECVPVCSACWSACVYPCECGCVCVYTHVSEPVCMHVSVPVCICMWMRVNVPVCICVWVCLCSDNCSLSENSYKKRNVLRVLQYIES